MAWAFIQIRLKLVATAGGACDVNVDAMVDAVFVIFVGLIFAVFVRSKVLWISFAFGIWRWVRRWCIRVTLFKDGKKYESYIGMADGFWLISKRNQVRFTTKIKHINLVFENFMFYALKSSSKCSKAFLKERAEMSQLPDK